MSQSTSSISSSSALKAAISQDETLVAVLVPSNDRGIIQIYPTDSGLLQSTLTTRQANSLQASTTATPVVLEKVLFCGNTHVVAKTSDSNILIWDLTRGGVVAHTLSIRNCLDVACHDHQVWVLLGKTKDDGDDNGRQKLVVHRYDPTSGKLLKKVKVGKSDNKNVSMALNQGEQVWLRLHKSGIKVFDSNSGEKVAHYKAAKGDTNTDGTGMLVCQHLVALPRFKGVALFNTKTNQWLETVPTSNFQPSVCLWQTAEDDDDDDDSILLLVDQALYKCSETGTELVRTLQSKHTLVLLPHDNQVTAILHNPASTQSSLQIQSVNWKDSDDEDLIVEWQDAKASSKQDTPRSSKRTAEEPLTVLGPGQAGGESSAVSERRKKQRLEGEGEPTTSAGEDEEGGETIADRLQKLSQLMDEDDEDDDEKEEYDNQVQDPAYSHFSVQKATTESLSQLLGQALQGGDDALLELALAVHNKVVIGETIAGLKDDHVDKLLTKLTMRLASKPNRADQLANWMSLVLLSGKVRHTQQLLPLRNLIQERLEAFPLLLQLEGRLTAIKAHGQHS